jgi:hypothetical protein
MDETRPIFQQIAEQIENEIIAGVLPRGVPSEPHSPRCSASSSRRGRHCTAEQPQPRKDALQGIFGGESAQISLRSRRR